MARLARKRRSDDIDSDEEDREPDTPPSPSASDASAASDRSKRARLSQNARARAGRTLNGDDAPSSRAPNGGRDGLPTAPTGLTHQPGSIVRLRLTNFVTYKHVEVFPGPSLNMVIGPNGTGKSTLVCAICLGLGWGPQHLGRARDVGEFVKHGCHEATIEIELRGGGGGTAGARRNTVIRCVIKRESNKCAFLLHGKPAGRKQVLAAARSLAIQVDNLCQFLPQDKVVAFAAMTPVELLRSTERAVGSRALIARHARLGEARKAQRALEGQARVDRDELAALEGRQRMQAADVERLREREAVQRRVEQLEAAVPVAAYRDARVALETAKAEQKRAARELRTLEDAAEPALRAVTAKQRYMQAVRAARERRARRRAEVEKRATDAAEKIADLQREVDRAVRAVEGEHKKVGTNTSDRRRLEGVCEDLKKRIEKGPPEYDIAALNDRIREHERSINALEEKGQEARAAMDEVHQKGRDKKQQVKEAEAEIASLDSQAGQQMAKLQKVAPDTWRAVKWLQANQDKFEKHVYGPPLVECSVTDTQYVDMIETLVQAGDMSALTVQTRADFQTLHRHLHDELKLKRLTIKTAPDGLDRFPRPDLDAAAMRRHGLDSWALDHLRGPEPVLAMLCDSARLHATGVSLRDTTPEQYAVIEAGRVGAWVTARSHYQIRRRAEYGAAAKSTVVRQVRRAQVWTDQPVDLSVKARLRAQADAWAAEADDLQKQLDVMGKSLDRLREQRGAGQQTVKDLLKEKRDKMKALTDFEALGPRLEQRKEEMAKAVNEINKIHDRIQKHEKKHDSLMLDKGQAVLAYAESVEVLRTASTDVIEAEIALLEAKSDYEVLAERNKHVKARLEALKKEVEALNESVAEHGDTAKALGKALKQATDAMDADAREFVRAYNAEHPDLTLLALQEDIAAERAKLELMHEGDGSIIARFEERARKIARLRERVAKLDRGLAEAAERLAALRARWEPELARLVALISDSFAFNMRQIGCAGQVSIDRPAEEADFDDWAVSVQVKFREGEPLSPLDAHRQSGGERAVSTIFYLMSLQALTRSPFRVVDEINQGMDPRNERLVHGRMVAIATGTDDWQPPPDLLQPAPGASDESDDDGEDAEGADGAAADGAAEASGRPARRRPAPVIHRDSDADEDTDDDAGNGEGDSGAPGAHRRHRRPEMRTGAATGVAGAAGSQYFLVTPKLLHELAYAPGMRVLNIVSGDNVGEYARGDARTQGVSFERAVAIRRALKAH